MAVPLDSFIEGFARAIFLSIVNATCRWLHFFGHDCSIIGEN
jgi:hypothetical protein